LNLGDATLIGAVSGDNVALVATGAPGTQALTNPAAITIPDAGNATPYPSAINVSGLGGTVSNVTVTLRNLTHTWPADVDVLLVGPGGQKVLLMSDTVGGNALNSITLTLSDAAAVGLPQSFAVASGSYKPTNFDTNTDAFPAPAPAGPFATTLSTFNGAPANGTWSLYVRDDGAGDQGVIAGGWSLTVTSVGGVSGTFDSKNVGNGKPVQVAGLTLTGTDAGNYTLTQPATTADITAINLLVTGITANPKVYDGVTLAALNVGGAGLATVLAGDTVTLNTGSAVGAFADKNVGIGKLVSVSGLTTGGVDAGNYILVQPTATADITARAVTPVIVANDKVYDGTTTATLSSQSVTGTIGAEVVTLGVGAANFDTKNIGLNKTVTATTLTLGGADAGNYALSAASAIDQADITARGLTVTADNQNRTYGAANPALTGTLAGVQGADNITATYTTAATPASPVGSYPIVPVLNDPAGDLGNYNVASQNGTLTISEAGATVTLGSLQPVYDGTGKSVTVATSPAGLTVNVTYDGSAALPINVGSYQVVATIVDANYQGAVTNTMLITPATLTVSGITASKVYDGTNTVTPNLAGAALVGVLGDDGVTLNGAGVSGTFDNETAGTGKPVQVAGLTLTGADAGNYVVTQPVVFGSITAATLTVSGITAGDKVYDANPTATLNVAAAALVGVIGDDEVTLSTAGAGGTFNTAAAGTGKPVQVAGLTLGGADAGNYVLTQPIVLANITAKAVTPVIVASDKVYDGTTTATLSSQSVTGTIGAEVVTLGVGAASFDTKNIGINKTVTATTLTLGGADAGNYALSAASVIDLANITKAGLSVTADNKSRAYGVVNPALTGTLAGVQGADNITATYTTAATQASPPGNYPIVPVLNDPAGDLANYTMVSQNGTLTITKAAATLTLGSLQPVYDGTGKSVTMATSPAGLTVNVTYDGGAALPINVGSYQVVATIVDANYQGAVTNTMAITKATLTVTGITASKVYDGTNTATLNIGAATLIGIMGDDVVTLSAAGASATFDNEKVGEDKPVQVTGLTLAGADAGNYTLTQPQVFANITPAQLTVTGITAGDKVYDANTVATLNVAAAALVGAIGDDVVTLSTAGASGTFNTPTIGIGKTVQVAGLTIGGADAGNYAVTQPTTSANITAKAVTPVIVANNKLYDGHTLATLRSRSVAGTIGEDVVALGVSTANFDTKNAGVNKTVTATGLSLGGADAGNYVLSALSASDQADITAKTVTPAIVANDKVYDGTKIATLASQSVTGTIGADVVALGVGAASFDTKDAGIHKPVTVTALTLSGADAGNYVLGATNATGQADITKAGLIVAADNKSRSYGIANPPLTTTFTGFVNEETFAISGITGSPDLSTTATNNSPAGNYPIRVTVGSLTALNYSFSFVEGTLTIAPPGQVTIASIARLGNNHAHITGTGDAGVKYTIQATSDLVNWQDIGTATANESGAFEFEDPNPAHLNNCFYRITLP